MVGSGLSKGDDLFVRRAYCVQVSRTFICVESDDVKPPPPPLSRSITYNSVWIFCSSRP